jgi:hypothetical protein
MVRLTEGMKTWYVHGDWEDGELLAYPTRLFVKNEPRFNRVSASGRTPGWLKLLCMNSSLQEMCSQCVEGP